MSPRVLVVADEEHILRLMEVNLRRQGSVVLSALSLESAIECALTHIPDLVVTDSKFANFKDELEKHPATKDIPVTVLSTRS